jgi:hypothetical protein
VALEKIGHAMQDTGRLIFPLSESVCTFKTGVQESLEFVFEKHEVQGDTSIQHSLL